VNEFVQHLLLWKIFVRLLCSQLQLATLNFKLEETERRRSRHAQHRLIGARRHDMPTRCVLVLAGFFPLVAAFSTCVPCSRFGIAPLRFHSRATPLLFMSADDDGEKELERVTLPKSLKTPQVQLQREKLLSNLARRSALGALSISSIVGYIKIYGESEESLRLYDQLDAALRKATGRPLAGVTQERVRAPLDPSFTVLVADAIEHVAVQEESLLDADELAAQEAVIAAKAARLFSDSDTSDIANAIQSGDWRGLYSSPEISSVNLALYARLRTLEGYLLSPASRKRFSSAVGARILHLLRARFMRMHAIARA